MMAMQNQPSYNPWGGVLGAVGTGVGYALGGPLGGFIGGGISKLTQGIF